MFIFIVFALIGCIEEVSVEDDLQELLDTIQIPTEVTGNLDLETSFNIDGNEVEAEWQTTASSVITKDGIVTVTLNDQNAILILKLTLGDKTLSKQFPIVVKGNDDYLLLYAVVQSQINFYDFELRESLILPTTYLQDDKIINAEWVSSNTAALSSSGTIYPSDEDVEVDLSLTLSINNIIREETFTFTVLRDPATEPVSWWHTVDVYSGQILNEALPPVTPQCFAGAIYRKVVSSKDYWLGIEAVVTVPEFLPDVERFDDSKQSYYLDNASVYMGGNANFESDIGLSWKIGYSDDQSKVLSRSGIAFRPFWRYITNKEPNCTNCFRNSNVNDFEYYYFPGDKIRMSVFTPEPGLLQMRIELLELTENVKYVNQRAKYNLGDDFNRVFTTEPFFSEGTGIVKTEFKRVNAIDQVSNEGKQTINTNSEVNDAIWHEVYLYREIDDDIYKVPLTKARSAAMTCPLGANINGDFSDAFKISYDGVNEDLGGEVISLKPNNGTGKLYNLAAIIVDYDLRKYYAVSNKK